MITSWARPYNFNVQESGAVRGGYSLRLLLLILSVITSWFIYCAAIVLLPTRQASHADKKRQYHPARKLILRRKDGD